MLTEATGFTMPSGFMMPSGFTMPSGLTMPSGFMVPSGRMAAAAATVATTSAAKSPPQGAAFDVVLMLHVGCFLISFVSVLVTGTQAWRARTGPKAPGAASVARYFKPGINWPGRLIYAVIVLGVVLIAMSGKVYSFSDAFVEIGLVLWIVVASLAEFVVWPGERSLQVTIAEHWTGGEHRTGGERRTGEHRTGGDGSPGRADAPDGDPSSSVSASGQDSAVLVANARQLATRVALSAWTVCAVMIVATVIMVDKP
ncbi:MAG: hypothetical protein WAM97_19455 [Acidimicrobiales bacterium]